MFGTRKQNRLRNGKSPQLKVFLKKIRQPSNFQAFGEFDQNIMFH
jgi:hypothetical protein